MKKVFGWIGKLLLTILIVVVAAFLYFWIKTQIYIGGAQDANVAYLAKHRRSISEATADTDLFDADFYNNQVFLLGENHGTADVQWVDQLLLKHLNRKIGLRYYIAEMDSIRAGRLNEFLTNTEKDTALLKHIVRDVERRIPQQASQELFEKWMSLHEYNQRLADSLKITIIGIDKTLEDTSRTITRDSAMFLNFRKAVVSGNLQSERFYGLFGYTHVLQSRVLSESFTPFAAKLTRSTLSLGRAIKSIVVYNLDSEVRLPPIGQFPTPPDEKTSLLNADGPLVMVKGINDLREVTEDHTITLFDLEAADSPYRKSQRLAGVKVNLMGGDALPTDASEPTIDFFQYVVLTRGSEALTRLE